MLGCIQPMSSPMMTTMLGFWVVGACACPGMLQPTRALDTASAPNAKLRTLAPKSIRVLLYVLPDWLSSLRGRVAMRKSPNQALGSLLWRRRLLLLQLFQFLLHHHLLLLLG